MTTFIRLVDYKPSKIKKVEFHSNKNKFILKDQNLFFKIPGFPIVYWASDDLVDLFDRSKLGEYADLKHGMSTSDNNRFLRFWHEINYKKIAFGITDKESSINSGLKWFPYNKGGPYRKWYGNNFYTVNWFNDGEEIKEISNIKYPYLNGKLGFVLGGQKYFYKPGITWSSISTGNISFRYFGKGFLFDAKGQSMFMNENIHYILALLNTKIINRLLQMISPTMDYNSGTISGLPIIFSEMQEINLKVSHMAKNCIKISKKDWDSRETSWDFTKNELIKQKQEKDNLDESYDNYCTYWKNQFFKLHQNEEELNKIFIDIYDLNDELTPNVPLEEITILKDETKIKNGELVFKKDVIIKQFLSYFVGCLMGRYSLEKDGLILANKGEALQDYLNKVPNPSFTPEDDNIIPILDDEYFDDDIITRLKEFLKTTFGEDSLSENLQFIADALYTRGKGSAEETIRYYFLKQFYKDHCKMYKKRPIYWLFSSGKQNAFNALIYMHRYNKETLAKLRIDYLHEYQSKLQARKQALALDSDDIKIRTQAEKEKTIINKKLKELQDYDQHLQNLANKFIDIDLDDGVKENYKKFSPLLAKI